MVSVDHQFEVDAPLDVGPVVLDVLRPDPAPDHDETPWDDVELGHDDRGKVAVLGKVGVEHGWETHLRVVFNVVDAVPIRIDLSTQLTPT